MSTEQRKLPTRVGGWDVVLAQWLHLAGAGMAGGSMLFIIFALLPSLAAVSPAEVPKLMGALFPRARLIFWLAIILLSLGGLYLSIVGSRITSFEMLFNNRYGQVLALKIALALVVSTLALLLTLPLQFLAPVQQNLPTILPVVLILALVVVLLGAVLQRMALPQRG